EKLKRACGFGSLDAEIWIGDGQRGGRCTRRACGSIIPSRVSFEIFFQLFFLQATKKIQAIAVR
ncbi:MAG: hypothetical protein WBM16_00005, partial [Pseudolabrys sp.]